MLAEILDIHGLTSVEELELLQELAKAAPAGKILEIGTFNGRSTAALCEAVGDDRVVSVDSYKMQHHGENNESLSTRYLANLGMQPQLHNGKSPLSARWLDENVPILSMVFIDGHHHPDTVSKELETYGDKLVLKGIIALHDYNCPEYPGYTEAIDAYFARTGWKTLTPEPVDRLVAYLKVEHDALL